MSPMAMMAPCDGDGETDWCHALGDFNFNMLLCSSSSTPQNAMATTSRAEDCLPLAAAPPPGPGGCLLQRCKTEVLDASPDDGAFAAADCLSSALINLQREDESFYLPMYSAPPAPVVGGDHLYCSGQLPPLPADGALASLDEALLLPFSDIDLAAFDNNADEHKPPLLDPMPMIAPPAAHHHHPPAAAGTDAPPIHGTEPFPPPSLPRPPRARRSGGGGRSARPAGKTWLDHIDDSADEHKPPPPPPVGQVITFPPAVHLRHPAAVTPAPPIRGAIAAGQNAGAIVVHRDASHEKKAVAVEDSDSPPSLPRPRRARRSGGGADGRSAAAPAGKTRLDHIGFDELRKYFYMPITRAAREMNVGLTVLKKRCRELGVARWPHRKMKSLKSLMANVQEMGNGMSPAVVQQELAALEACRALMEEHPWIELTDRTKKLRQACFKESYRRRRAAAVSAMEMEMDHIYSFGQQQLGHHLQLLPPPPASSADDHRHGHQQSSSFFGY